MSGIVFFSFIVLISKVHSQLCSPPILPLPSTTPCVPIPSPPIIPPCPTTSPQVINPNPYVTTIVDNSVSSALVNALQLLIVSNLIGATVGSSPPSFNNLGPLLESIVCPNSCPVEVVPEYVTYAPSYDLFTPCGPVPTCAPYFDLIPPYPIPACSPNYEVIPPRSPIPCGPSYELIPPCPITDPYPPSLCGLTDVISPNYFTYTESITPICIDAIPYNGYGDLLFPLSGLESINPNFCGPLTELIPNYINYPIPEICPSLNPFYGGFAETITPTVAALPNVFGCLNEVLAPCLPPLANVYAPESPFASIATVAPNYFGGLSELSVPLAAEVIFPPGIPTPLTCNYGYSASSLPCVRVNVEPLAYDNCLYSGYNGPIYY